MIEDTDMKKCSLESDEGRTQQAGGSPVQAVRSLYINKYGEDPTWRCWMGQAPTGGISG